MRGDFTRQIRFAAMGVKDVDKPLKEARQKRLNLKSELLILKSHSALSAVMGSTCVARRAGR
jgi:hypothetical protein